MLRRRIRIVSAIAALFLSASAVAANTGHHSSDFARFKRKMMPKVGRKTALVGVLASAKLGWIVTSKGGGVYIYALRDSDAPKMKALDGLSGRTVKATGTLRYSPGSPPALGGPASSNRALSSLMAVSKEQPTRKQPPGWAVAWATRARHGRCPPGPAAAAR